MAKKPEHRGTFTRAQSQRQLRVGENIRRALAQILQRDGLHDPALAQTSITIGEVRSSSDLKTAHIYALPLGGENAPAVIEALNRNASEIRFALNKHLAMKFSPQLRFFLDETFDHIDQTRALLDRDAVRADVAKDG